LVTLAFPLLEYFSGARLSTPAVSRRILDVARDNLTSGPRANDRETTFGFQSLRDLGVYRYARRTLMIALFPTPLFAAGEIFFGRSLIATLGDRVRTRRR